MNGGWRQRRLLMPGLLIGILLLIGLLAAISAVRENKRETPSAYPDYDVHSAAPDGTRALALWLRDLGYTPRTLEYEPFKLRRDDGLLFILFPTIDANDAQISEIDAWVRDGGTLVLASGQPMTLLEHFGIVALAGDPEPVDVRPLQPLALAPPLQPTQVRRFGDLLVLNPAWVPLLGDGVHLLAASRSVGNGRVIALSSGDPFSNAGLKQPGNVALALNLLAGMPPDRGVVIDEYHHGLTEQGTLGYRLVHEPWGWALIFLALSGFLYLALSGRRFGSIVKPYAQGTRRARAEYATTLALLLQQGGHRAWLRDQYLDQLTRRLATRFRLHGSATTGDFLLQLMERAPAAVALAEPLRRLDANPVPDEQTLVRLIRETEQITAELID
ncbi:MAG TPA: DUF4350 domain-containing protein [Nitrolancea sp.]|nr:DUF4350 domain-containing protein [Nitrolancea sp.]